MFPGVVLTAFNGTALLDEVSQREEVQFPGVVLTAFNGTERTKR
jgi:hypothetical protein